MAMRIVRRQVPLVLTFLTGMIYVSEWFVRETVLTDMTTGIANFIQTATVFVFLFSTINLTVIHVARIRRQLRGPKQLREIFLSSFLLAMIYIVGIVSAYYTVVRGWKLPSATPEYMWWYNNWYLSSSATAYAGTLFYIIAATYRILRIRSRESLVLIIGFFIALLYTTPVATSYIFGLSSLGEWLDRIIVTAANRAIMIGVGIGAILMGIRTLLAMETGYLGAREE